MMEEGERDWGGDTDSKREILPLIIFKSSDILCEVMGILSYFKNREKKRVSSLEDDRKYGMRETW